MSDYIKRESALDTIEKYEPIYKFNMSEREQGYNNALEIVAYAIGDIPSADVVEVVRCKDCIHNDQCKHRVVMWVEDPMNTWHKDIDFCSYGERKEK